MAKQTFTTGQVLTAAQMTSLQQTAMLGGAASAKTASYTLVAADAGTAISMSNAGATTITVNTGLFAAGDTVQITNLGAGVCTITAGTATVNSSAALALAQYESGTLDFTSASDAIFIKGAGAAAGGSGPAFYATLAANQSVSTATTTKIAYNSEIFDTDNCYSTTNYRFTPTKAGIYQVNAGLRVTGSGGYNQIDFYKNGSSYALLFIEPDAQNGSTNTVVSLIQLNGSTDYIEMFGYAGGAGGSNFTPTGSFFSAVWIRGL